jgi:integrase
VASLKVGSPRERRGVVHLTVFGKGSKTRYVPLHQQAAGHGEDRNGPLFRPIRSNGSGTSDQALSGSTILRMVKSHGAAVGIKAEELCLHALRATAATNALEHQADLAFVQKWLGHANVSTMGLYDRRRSRPEDNPTFKVSY